jgi:hypothetical protein
MIYELSICDAAPSRFLALRQHFAEPTVRRFA